MKNIVIFGAPGSGKGTQSDLMIEKYGFNHISTGDVLRAEIKNGTELGKTAKGYIDNGQLIPDELMVNILASVYDSFGKEHKGVIFDGFPRTIPQAEALKAMLAERGHKVAAMIELDVPEEELMKRAVKVGADVPYCVMRGTALAEGIGEKLTRLPRVPHCYVLVGKPGVNVSTKTAYENLKLNDPAVVHPDIDGMVTAVRNGDLDGMISRMGNVFEPGIISKYPVIQEIKDLMESNGARKAMMSGSGPTVFGIFDDKEKMEWAAAVLRESRMAKTVFATDVF